jgi:hypothetical protein
MVAKRGPSLGALIVSIPLVSVRNQCQLRLSVPIAVPHTFRIAICNTCLCVVTCVTTEGFLSGGAAEVVSILPEVCGSFGFSQLEPFGRH